MEASVQPTRVCAFCGPKPVSAFRFRGRGTYQRKTARCYECKLRVLRERRWARGENRKTRHAFNADTRRCARCKRDVDAESFRSKAGKWKGNCKPCRSALNRERYLREAEERKAYFRERWTTDDALRARKRAAVAIWRMRNRERDNARRRELWKRKKLWAVNGWKSWDDVKAWIARDEQAFKDEENLMAFHGMNRRIVGDYNIGRIFPWVVE